MTRGLSDLGEFGLIDLFRAAGHERAWVHTGIGDDCAVLRPGGEDCLLVTTDSLVEGVHFERAWMSPYQLGHKALAVSLSDVAAMGGEPLAVFLNLAWTKDVSEDFVLEFRAGFTDLADRHRVDLLGGDTVAGRRDISVTTTVLGRAPGSEVIRRAGASAGDGLFLGRTVGDSAAGLALLTRGEAPAGDRRFLLDAHLTPAPQVALGRALAQAGVVSAMIDVSDGLLQDLGHLAAASGLGAEIESERIPLSDAARRLAADLDLDPLDWALSGGEDYCLLFAVPADQRDRAVGLLREATGGPAREIGRLVTGSGIRLGTASGWRDVPARGHDHFRPPSRTAKEDE